MADRAARLMMVSYVNYLHYDWLSLTQYMIILLVLCVCRVHSLCTLRIHHVTCSCMRVVIVQDGSMVECMYLIWADERVCVSVCVCVCVCVCECVCECVCV